MNFTDPYRTIIVEPIRYPLEPATTEPAEREAEPEREVDPGKTAPDPEPVATHRR